jgi:NAD(P)-dependent dehydrogenase (short-subunit alcohol dehydrogenase family)
VGDYLLAEPGPLSGRPSTLITARRPAYGQRTGRQHGCPCRARTSDLCGGGRLGVSRTANLIVSVVLDRFGRLDIPVNNAGVFIGEPLTDYATV